jgi:class 3 adenylate cyclase
MSDLPQGTVSFLFTDVENVRRLIGADDQLATAAVLRQREIITSAIESHAGHIFEISGDSVCAVFSRGRDGVAAAFDAQLALQAASWGAVGPLRVSMGLHTADAQVWAGQYSFEPLLLVGVLVHLAYGGQVLLSGAAAALVRNALPDRASLRHLGWYRLSSRGDPERVAQLVHPDLPSQFPPLRGPESSQNDTPLTLREREVAALVAGGRSNRQIAEQLVISERTAEKHISSILTKLRFEARSQIAVWAVEHKLSAVTARAAPA